MTKYQNRRRVVAGLIGGHIFFLLDQMSPGGTSLPVVSAWAFFICVSMFPLLVGVILDEFENL